MQTRFKYSRSKKKKKKKRKVSPLFTASAKILGFSFLLQSLLLSFCHFWNGTKTREPLGGLRRQNVLFVFLPTTLEWCPKCDIYLYLIERGLWQSVKPQLVLIHGSTSLLWPMMYQRVVPLTWQDEERLPIDFLFTRLPGLHEMDAPQRALKLRYCSHSAFVYIQTSDDMSTGGV